MVLILFGVISTLLTFGTSVNDDCKKHDYKPEACKVSKILNKGE